ncbi:tRNA(Met) cytidine acetyltransferase TmcA domain-containing protein [Oceanicoccus sp. KOV_DT_Chl]|uniref:tRNA(Met) cytidine acetyltransferase TmcA domain-containing protein n=1 Tax=Oceanicoccus sp. KOV_DT_Chl TaxID=1904639 RepID=UPI000C7D0C94|nr:tRNA(Met) cytidine acetyltransferase TmcA domain-containing protein [Oceanicoccus sp. KOV_DT_Chl]
MPDNAAIVSAIQLLKSAAEVSRQRRLLVLAGDKEWSSAVIAEYLAEAAETIVSSKLVWIGEQPNLPQLQSMPSSKARQLLGQEVELLIYDGWSGIDADALAASSGAIAGGGLFILLLPTLSSLTAFLDPQYQRLLVYPYTLEHINARFLARLQHYIATDKALLLIEQGQAVPQQKIPVKTASPLIASPDHCLTADQSQAVAAIMSVQRGHSRRPLVISSDRGRGKSSALGIAAAELLEQGIQTITVTAPSRQSVVALFDQVSRLLGVDSANKNSINYHQSQLIFAALMNSSAISPIPIYC